MTSDTVGIGTEVIIRLGNKERVFRIVSSEKTDVNSGCISQNSPVAKSILGKEVGYTGTVALPNGTSVEISVIKINKH